MMESVIFLHSRGAELRRKIIRSLYLQENEKIRYCSSTLARKSSISKVAMKKHIDYLVYLGYIDKINPMGKPIFLRLTPKGSKTAKKFLYY